MDADSYALMAHRFPLIKEQMMKIHFFGLRQLSAAAITVGIGWLAVPAHAALTLSETIALAIERDPYQQQSMQRQASLLARSQAADNLPDTIVSAGLVNLPVDGFAFDQEPMTQARIGVSQAFLRGQTGSLQARQLQQIAEVQPIKRIEQQQKVRLQVTQLWLEARVAYLQLALLEQRDGLFEQLVDTVSANYASASSNTLQQDVISAQLERDRLQDQRFALRSTLESRIATLHMLVWQGPGDPTVPFFNFAETVSLPALDKVTQQALQSEDLAVLAELLTRHPAVKALDQEIAAQQTRVELSEQAFKPKWGVQASYGLRADTPQGDSRADFLSVGVNVSMPLFSGTRTDQQRQAEVLQRESQITRQRLLLRQMLAEVKSAYKQWYRATDRHNQYQHAILPQLDEYAQASLTAYTNNRGNFTDVMRSNIDALNGQLTAIELDALATAQLARLQFYLATDTIMLAGEIQ